MKPFDLAIATTTYFSGPYGTIKDKEGSEFRKGTFLAMLESIKNVDWGGRSAVLCVRDDSVEADFPSLPDIGIPIRVERNEKVAGCPLNLTLACNDAAPLAPLVIYVDNDALFSKRSILRLFAMMEAYPDVEGWGLFNTKYHIDVAEYPGVVIKQSMCEHGLCFRSAKWDYSPSYGLIAYASAAGIQGPYPTLKPSGVQHCGGKYGLNGTEDDFDQNFRIDN